MTIAAANDIKLCKNNILKNVSTFQSNERRHLSGSPCSKMSVYSYHTFLILEAIFKHFDLLGNLLKTRT